MKISSGMTKLGAALAIVFVVLLAALLAQLILVLWRRRTFRRCGGGAGNQSPSVTFTSPSFFSAPSKELFLFLCLRTDTHHLSRVEPDTNTSLQVSTPSTPESAEMELIDLLKLSGHGGGLYGPSKILFTIEEEEKEDLESVCSSVEKVPKKRSNSKRRSLEECFEASPEISPEMVATAADHCCVDIETAPFSTPSDSPSFFTPSASPAREVGDRVVPT